MLLLLQFFFFNHTCSSNLTIYPFRFFFCLILSVIYIYTVTHENFCIPRKTATFI